MMIVDCEITAVDPYLVLNGYPAAGLNKETTNITEGRSD